MSDLESSTVASADHDPVTGELIVQFRNGSRYAYADVPPDVADGIHSAPSAGGYLNEMIKGNYAYRRL